MRAALLASALVLFATACDMMAVEPDDGECPRGRASGLSIVIGGASMASDLSACASDIGAGVIVSIPGWTVSVSSGGQPGTNECNYEHGGVMATLTRLDDNETWEAYGGEPESSCTMTVAKATADGVPISGSFAGQLVRYPLDGGKEIADVSFSFQLTP